MEAEGSNLLNLADSVLLKKESSFRELSQTEGPFKKYFCSTVDEVTTSFCLDSRIFGQSPIFEPKTRQKPVVSVKPFERNVSLEDDQEDHWTKIARDEKFRDLTISDTWESLPKADCPIEADTKGELALSEIGESGTVHQLWSIARDRLSLVSNVELFDVEIIPEATFLTDLTNLMSGLESSTFAFNPITKTFGMRRHFVIENISFETLQSFVESFLQMGNNYRRLEMICNSVSKKNHGQTYIALVSGLKSFLRLYRTTIVQVSLNRKLLELNFIIVNFRRQLNFVSKIFSQNLPDGIPLLVHLCEQTLPVNTTDLHHLSVFLFRSAAKPFFRFFQRWAFLGKMDSTSSEFGLSVSVADTYERNRRFWTNAFTMNGSCEGFGFLHQLLPMIVTCGKTINFLNLNDTNSRIVNFAPKLLNDEVELIMTPVQEEEVKSKYSEFHANFKLLCQEQNGQSFASSKGITPTSSTVVEKWENSEIPSKNKYPSKFDLFDCHMTDILSKVRKERQSNVSQNPCFTPLIILMEKSVLLPLRFQLSILNEKGVFFLLRDSNLLGHLCAIRRYLFFGDQEFSHNLCSSLFFEMTLHPNTKWGPGQLSSFVESAISSSPFASKDLLAKNVSFYVDDNLGRSIRESSLTLSYKTDWPVNIILTDTAMESYRKIFTFLIQIVRCTWGLGQVFMRLKNNRDPEVQTIHLIRHQMTHFVLLLDTYVKSIIIEQSWITLNEDFNTKSKSIDDIYEAHNSYINRIMFRCFLNAKAEPVKKLITDILNIVSTFCEMVIRDEWSSHLCRSRIESLFTNFKEHEKFLSVVLWKLSNRGYQQHLQEFLLQLDAKFTENKN